MPSNDILVALGVLTALVLSTLMPFFITRQIQKSDRADADWKKSMEARMSVVEDHGHQTDLALQSRVTREDLERLTKSVYDEIKDLRTNLENKFDGFQRTLLEAIRKP